MLLLKFFVISILNSNCCYASSWKNDENCGPTLQVTPRIVGGTQSSEAKYPWMARLGVTTNIKGRYNYLCGGSLINRNFVVTAAHCLEEGLEVVRLGETTIVCVKPNCTDPKVQQIHVRKQYKHPKFSTVTGFADIALLELSHPVVYTDYVQPICLTDRRIAEEDDMCITAGFGTENPITKEKPTGLKELFMKIISGPICESSYPNADFTTGNYICAGGTISEDTCNGDSGGPFMKTEMTENGPRVYLVGVTSFGTPICGRGFPGIFTSISFHLNWINEIVSQRKLVN